MRAYLQMKSSKLITEIIKPLTERGAELDRATQKLIVRAIERGQSAVNYHI